MFNRAAYANSRPDGLGVLEVEAPSPARQFVPLQRTAIAGAVFGPLAALTVTQRFRFATSDFARPIEARYRFPLPGDAAVVGVTVRFGDVEITAALAEREAAEQTYRAAVAEGRQAALVTREAPDVFTLAVAGIPPETDVDVETAYVQLARPEAGGWSLRVPLTTAPRYVREDEATGRHAHGQPLAVLRDPGHRATLALTFHGAERIEGSLDLAVTDGVARLAAGEVVPDRDLVLSWRPAQETAGAALRAIAHRDADGRTYFLACAAPPAQPAGPRLAREVVLLVDNSGSMGGAKWQAALWAVRSFVGSLLPQDRFALAFFENRAHWFREDTLPASPENLAGLEAFLQQHGPSGGTELGLALGEAYALPKARHMAARHLLVITDAEVSDGGRILRSVEQAAAQADFRRTSILCIDAAPNAHLVEELALAGCGSAHFLTSSADEEDVATTLDAILEEWGAPAYANLAVVTTTPDVESPGRQVVAARPDGPQAAGAEIDAGDLPAGRAAWVHGRIRGHGPLALRLVGDAPAPQGADPDGGLAPVIAPVREELGACEALVIEGELGRALKALFGARKLNGLEQLAHAHHGADADAIAAGLRKLGYDPADVAEALGAAPIYPEQRARFLGRALQRFLIEESLAYGIPCSETAFVATRREAGQPIARTVPVANALPAGMDSQFEVRARAQAPMMSAPAPLAAMSLAYAPPADLIHDASLGSLMQPSSRPAPSAPRGAGKLEAPGSALRDAAARQDQAGPEVYAGHPVPTGGRVVLFDGQRPAGVIRELAVRFRDGSPARLDPELAIVLYVDDMSAPRAKVKLADLLRQGGRRPLNVAVGADQQVRVLLLDPNEGWGQAAPYLTVSLG